MTETPRNDAAMAEILASMRRIVSESEQRARRFSEAPDDPEILVLTPEMRLDASPARSAGPTEGAGSAAFKSPVVPAPEAPARQAESDAPAPSQAVPARDDAAALLDGAPDMALDEAAVADIVRAVLREEFNGPFGRSLTQQIRTLVQNEVARTLTARQQGD